MKLNTFFSFYNLENESVERIYSKNNSLYIILRLSVYIELMANGCRPVIDMNMRHLFIFDDFKKNIDEKNPVIKNYRFENNKILFLVNDREIEICSKEVIVKENYTE